MKGVGSRQFGPYQLIERIGGGGMADIFLAKTGGIAGFEKHLALKMIRENHSDDPAFVEMLVNEAKIAVRLSHSNIVQVFDLGRIDDRYYLAMEFVDGLDLHALLVETSEAGKFIPFETVAFIIQETCAGLFYAHERDDETGEPLRIVHRDVSPHNVLLSYTGDVKVTDFGIAKANVQREDTQLGVLKGKFSYMSPEQARGEPLDARSDLFSLGIVLYEMLTGQMLFRETEPLLVLNQVRAADIAPPSRIRREIPQPLEDVVMKALSRDRRDRFEHAEEMRRELVSFLSRYAPGYSSRELAEYLNKVLSTEASPVVVPEPSPPREKPASSSSADDLRTRDDLSLMDRGEFPLDTSTSLVYSMNNLQAMATGTSSPPEEFPTRSIKRPAIARPGAGDAIDLAAIQAESLRLAETAEVLDEDADATKLADRNAIQGALAKMASERGLPEPDSGETPTHLVKHRALKQRAEAAQHASTPPPEPVKPVRKGQTPPPETSSERMLWWIIGGFTLLALGVVLLVLLV